MIPEDAALVLRAHISIVIARCCQGTPSSAIPGVLQPLLPRRIRKCKLLVYGTSKSMPKAKELLPHREVLGGCAFAS